MSASQRYQKRISGPLIDLNTVEAASDTHVDVKRVPYQKLTSMEGGETSASIRSRIETARTLQLKRFAGQDKPDMIANGDMGIPR